MGYDDAQREALRATLEACGAEVVVAGTPVDLAAALGLRIPVVRARYEYASVGSPGLGESVDALLASQGLGQ